MRFESSENRAHTGTLDPDATGVLPICIGKATRLAEYITGLPKVYRGELQFSITTASQDAAGEILEVKDASHLTLEQIEACLPTFFAEKFGKYRRWFQ